MEQEQNRLLVVDDDVGICTLFSEVAEGCGYVVKTINTVFDFKATYEVFKPTLLFIDLNIADKDGIELLQFLSKHNCKSPVVVISGHDEKVRSSVFRLGKSYGLEMVLHLPKPVSVPTLRDILEREKSRILVPSLVLLAKAIQHFDFILHYQPLISFNTKKIEGVEALVRWTPPVGGMFFPESFIPLAEQSELIKPLTHWIIEHAFQQSVEWNLNHDFYIAINLSQKVLDSVTVADDIIALATQYRIDPSKICFEITETSAMAEPQIVMEILARLRIKGFKLSIDDFGTGYSSLVELHRLPFSEMKIDRSFVTNIMADTQCYRIAKSVIELGHSLDLIVVAEGVEDNEAWDKLITLGCDIAQGYYMSKPLSAKDFEHWLKKYSEEVTRIWKK